MEIPHWVIRDISQLPKNFTGTIVIECWDGGVSAREFKRSDRKTKHQVDKDLKVGLTD